MLLSRRRGASASDMPPQRLKTNQGSERWLLRLYVAGKTARCEAAEANLRKVCEEFLAGRYNIEIVDLLENPTLAQGDQILAVPTLVRKLPLPVRRIIGDLSNRDRV